MDKDYYKIMGLNQDASEKDIKLAYRRLARKYHPDLSKEANAEERFKEMGEAYDVLKDPAKRAEYDHYLKNKDFNQNAQQGHYWREEHTGSRQQPQFDDDFFESLFGHARQALLRGKKNLEKEKGLRIFKIELDWVESPSKDNSWPKKRRKEFATGAIITSR